LLDPQGRTLAYLRLSVTDRCNLRCRYCMPADGIELVDHADVLSFEETTRLCALFTWLGVRRIRVTGGEPLARRGLTDLLRVLADLPAAPEVLLTTNGVLLGDRLDAVRAAGVHRVNLSLDSLDRATYARITRRDALPRVLPLLDAVPAAGLGLKLNVVVLPGLNDGELPDFAALCADRDLTVRFIEAMPFDGGDGVPRRILDGEEILARLCAAYPLARLPDRPAAVDELYAAPGWRGRVGLIRGHSRTFCGDCNRLRLDARGRLRTCLYGDPAADLGALLRGGADDAEVIEAVRAAVGRRLPDGHAAQRARDAGAARDSMASIGG
jgi:cyclic pyranopterin phosphate synthase